MIEDEFADWMHNIQVEPFTGDGAWGESFGAPQTVPAHWSFKNRSLIASNGKTVVSSTQVQTAPEWRSVLNEGARVTLPGDPRQYRVVQVGTWPGEDSQLEVDLV